MDNLIISQGTMLSSGATNPNVPGTKTHTTGGTSVQSTGVGKVTSTLISAGASLSGNYNSGAIEDGIRRSVSATWQAATPKGLAKELQVNPTRAAAEKQRAQGGPSTFVQKVLGGHLPTSWLLSGP